MDTCFGLGVPRSACEAAFARCRTDCSIAYVSLGVRWDVERAAIIVNHFYISWQNLQGCVWVAVSQIAILSHGARLQTVEILPTGSGPIAERPGTPPATKMRDNVRTKPPPAAVWQSLGLVLSSVQIGLGPGAVEGE